MTLSFKKKIRKIDSFSCVFLKNNLWAKEINCPKFQKIKDFISKQGINLYFEKNLYCDNDKVNGYAINENSVISIFIDSSLIGGQLYSTIIHEIAHVLLGHLTSREDLRFISHVYFESSLNEVNDIMTGKNEVEAQTVSTIILNDMGIKYLNYKYIGYIKEYKKLAQGIFNYNKVSEVVDTIEKGL